MANSHRISVITLAWNRRTDLRQLLLAVEAQTTPGDQIIVVDNASDDGTGDMVRLEFPDVRVIRLDDNQSLAGYNWGLQAAQGEILVLLDSDAVPAPDVLRKVKEKFAQDARLGLAAFRVVERGGETAADNPMYSPEGNVAEGYPALDFNGTGVALRAGAAWEAGGFSARFGIYLLELDFATRVAEAGYLIRYFPDIVVTHKCTFNPLRESHKQYYTVRNWLWYCWTYYAPAVALTLSWRRLAREAWNAYKRRLLPRFLQAVVDAAAGMPEVLAHRRPLQRAQSAYAKALLEREPPVLLRACGLIRTR